jgi:Mg2+/Co2+ transporter CorB
MQYFLFFIAFCLSPTPSGFFSGSETALSLTTRTDGAIGALSERPQQTLLSILFCNHWANTIPVVVLSSWATVLFGPSWGVIVMIAHGFHQLCFGEMLAKAYSQLYADKIAGFVSPILVPIVSLLGPWLVKIAPSRKKTAAELCLEERLKAESEAGTLTMESLIASHGIKELPKGQEVKLKASHSAKIIDIERIMMRKINNDYKAPAFFFIAVYNYPTSGEPTLLGYLHYTSFQFKDWDHNN